MIRKINRFGEVSYSKNEALVTMPFIRLDTEDVEILEENYRQKIKELNYTDSFFYANHFSAIRDRLQMSYDLEGCVDFHHIHRIKLADMLPFLYSMVAIAKEDANVLWERNNFAIDLTEKKVKALIFEFDGFNLYKKNSKTDGLKELILLALTKNHTILGKPKRADFIEKTDEVIQFSEDILACTSIKEIEDVINSFEQHLEYEQLKIENEIEEKKKKNKLFALKERFSKKEPIAPEEAIKKQLHVNYNEDAATNEKEKKSFTERITSPKGMIITLSIVAVGFLVYNFVDLDNINASADALDETKKQVELQNEILEAYRLYVSGDEDDIEVAYTKMDDIGYENLPMKDKETLINWYMEQGQYTKAISTDEKSAYIIGDNIINSEEPEKAIEMLEELENQFDDNTVLKFDIAALKEQNQIVIENSNLTELNDRRANAIIKAFVLTNQIEELDKFVESYKEDEENYDMLQKHYDRYVDRYIEKSDLIKEVEGLEGQLEGLKERKKNTDDKEKEKEKELDETINDTEKEIKNLQTQIDSIDDNIREE